jgi:hypothetical protein
VTRTLVVLVVLAAAALTGRALARLDAPPLDRTLAPS